MRVWLRDFNGDVDGTSVEMTINGAIVEPSSFPIPNGLRLSYHLSEDEVDYNQDVFVQIPTKNVMG